MVFPILFRVVDFQISSTSSRLSCLVVTWYWTKRVLLVSELILASFLTAGAAFDC